MLKNYIIVLVILLFPLLGFSQSPNSSKLSSGNWVKIGVTESGIYTITKSFLTSNGISLSNVTPNQIKVYGFGGRPLPEKNGVPHFEDLPELAVKIHDIGALNVFDDNDLIHFYAVGPNPVSYNTSLKFIEQSLNPYSDTSYYFIRVDASNTVSAPTLRNFVSGTASINVNKYVEIALIEKDSSNITHSGRNWYWKSFEFLNSYKVSHDFQGGHFVDSAKIKVDVITRCVNCTSTQSVMLNGSSIGGISIFPSGDSYNSDIGLLASGLFNVPATSTFNFQFPKPSNVKDVWLDRININATRTLALYGNQTSFRHPASLGGGLVYFQVANAIGATIWDVTNPIQAIEQEHFNGNFQINGGALNEFVVFNPYLAQKQPFFVKKVQNQNLHGLTATDILIISPKEFIPAASRLANHRLQHDNFTSTIVTPEAIYNEFSSGAQDPTAIRNFMKMFYERSQSGAPMVKYLLLFGDATYDYKEYLNRVPDNTDNVAANKNRNFVPTWETKNSVSRTGGSYPSDDYFVMVDGNNLTGTGESEALNVFAMLASGVGRILAYDEASADHMVTKIIHYDLSNDCKRDWRNKILLLADDMDESWEGNFVGDSENIGNLMRDSFPVYNVDKIYADAYSQVVSNGQRYPEVTKQVFTQLNNGVLLFNYIGHGGEIGLGGERYLSIDDVNQWQNYDRLPVLLTATCTFTRFDLAKSESAGEMMARRADGGAIALFSTSRAISLVNQFNAAFYKATFTPNPDGTMPRFGDIFRLAKNYSTDFTSSPISLFGDPSQKMAYPENRVTTTGIYDENDQPIDTMKATQVVKIKGNITDPQGFILTDFNGLVYPTIFDKASNYVTKQNDAAASQFNFLIQKNILFKGSAEVENGQFEFVFKVPKDINYAVGNGKISYYASSATSDAHGYDTSLVGSSLNNCNETKGPTISIFLNDSPVLGQTISSNPELKVVFNDDSGINSSGLGIGHDIQVEITNNNGTETFNLNEYYSAYKGDFTHGELRYPLLNMSQGAYVLKVTAWDNCNNPGESQIYFEVDTNHALISEFLPYPNPSDGQITFAFHHNLPEEEVRALLQVYNVNGSLVYSKSEKLLNSKYRNTQLTWDGNSVGGHSITPGVYFCRLTLVSASGKVAYGSSKIIRSK